MNNGWVFSWPHVRTVQSIWYNSFYNNVVWIICLLFCLHLVNNKNIVVMELKLLNIRVISISIYSPGQQAKLVYKHLRNTKSKPFTLKFENKSKLIATYKSGRSKLFSSWTASQKLNWMTEICQNLNFGISLSRFYVTHWLVQSLGWFSGE